MSCMSRLCCTNDHYCCIKLDEIIKMDKSVDALCIDKSNNKYLVEIKRGKANQKNISKSLKQISSSMQIVKVKVKEAVIFFEDDPDPYTQNLSSYENQIAKEFNIKIEKEVIPPSSKFKELYDAANSLF
ncbi:hypothetical protein GCM10007981_00510 [Thermocladium modestius]|uniref:Endonuclease n=1 Tax=Thermocladium modestius TaxID=62609 RepID=A0A830GRC4_9CREN|nr:hypothetical protein [Thermocladium modestius]GGP18920.1 hypothetical protein GCM10007981_00510 [Thermocladium modestius]